MENEYGYRVYRKLLYFFENKIKVHFDLNITGEWFNGEIIDLNEKKLTLVLKENILGDVPFLLEDINEDSISKFTPKGEN
jgi:hypothetical protein